MTPLVRRTVAALAAGAAVCLLAVACGQPQVPIAESMLPNALVTATPTPEPPTPTPTVTPIPTAAPEAGTAPTATPLPVDQPGLDEESVRIAVIADGDTGGTADDLFRDAWTGMGAWAESVNDRGGLGSRLVNVVTLDTSLFNHRGVLEVVCRGDYFAIVGGRSLADYEGAELLGTEHCNLLDVPSAVHGARRAISPVTFVSNPILNDRRQAGPARWLAQEFPDAADNVALFYFDDLKLRNETERLREMLLSEGMTTVSIATNLEEGPSERVVARYEEFESQAIVWNADPDRLVDLLRELRANDLEPAWVLCEFGCYSRSFLEEGTVVEGVYAWIPHAPIDSPTAADEFIAYRYWLNQFSEGVDWSEISLQAWMAGRLFEEAFNRMLVAEPEAPTRELVISAAETINDFTANRMLPLTDPGARRPTPCFALVVVRDGEWRQAHPQPPRDLDCDVDNLFDLTATRGLGLEDPVATSATNSDLAEDLAAEDQAGLDNLDNPDEPDDG